MTIIEALSDLDRIADSIDEVWNSYQDERIKRHIDEANRQIARAQLILAQQLIEDYQEYVDNGGKDDEAV